MQLYQNFEKVCEIKSRAKRGKAFEILLKNLFKINGFDVVVNPGISKPRQTDLYARKVNISYLVEAKWQQDRIDVNDLDALKSRLRRTTADVVGIIFSMAGYTKNVIKEIENDRTREILLFTPYEIATLIEERISLGALIEKKREYLKIHGIVWFYAGKKKKIRNQLSESCKTFYEAGNEYNFVASKSGDAKVLFSHFIPGIESGAEDSFNVMLKFYVSVNDVEGIADILNLIDETFGLKYEGSFSIGQINDRFFSAAAKKGSKSKNITSWFGFGANNFVETIKKWKERYIDKTPIEFTYCERLSYFNEFQDGWFFLSCIQDISIKNEPTTKINGIEMIIQLPGIQFDNTRLEEFCRNLGNEDVRISIVNQHLIQRIIFKRPVKVEVISEIISDEIVEMDGQISVCGVVVKNPFYKKRISNRVIYSDHVLSSTLQNVEYLICSIDWYTFGNRFDKINLDELEIIKIDNLVIMNPSCSWNEVLEENELKYLEFEEVRSQLKKQFRKRDKTRKLVSKTFAELKEIKK